MSGSLFKTICWLLLCWPTIALGQELIPNGSFETYRNCPYQGNLLFEAVPWYNPNGASPDFFNECFPTPQIQLPPRTGRGLAGLFFDQGHAEYVATPLKKPLLANTCYSFELYIATEEPDKYVVGTIGAYFSPQSLTATSRGQFSVNPQVLDAPFKTIATPFKWERIGGTFKAKGGEQFVTIGSFKTEPKFLGYYYVFIDDISLRPIELNLGKDTTLCGSRSTLTLHSTTPSATAYRWQDGSTDSTYRVTKPGTYWVTVTTPCVVLHDTITVDYALPFSLGADTTICIGSTLTLRGPTNAPNYRWQDGSSLPTFLVNKAGLYSLKVSQASCVATDSIRVAFVKPPQLALGPNKALCGADVYTIQPVFSEGRFSWQDSADKPERILSQSGNYVATVTNACATVRDSVQIDYGECGCVIYTPDVFTPNADGHNDLFIPLACGDITILSMSVFTRWGEPIFRTDTAPFQWDGVFNGLVSPAGVYTWRLDYVLHQRDKTSRKQKEGRLLLTY